MGIDEATNHLRIGTACEVMQSLAQVKRTNLIVLRRSGTVAVAQRVVQVNDQQMPEVAGAVAPVAVAALWVSSALNQA